MSYVTTEYAKTITGVDIPQELLDEATAIIHNYTDLRWSETTVTDMYFDGDGKSRYIFLVYPIITINSLYIEDIEQTENTNFEVSKKDGYIDTYRELPYGIKNIKVTYKYGFTSDHDRYNTTLPLVKGAEARIALYLMKNPLLNASVSMNGTSVNYNDDVINILLSRVPKSVAINQLG